jgi:hypothetical protein
MKLRHASAAPGHMDVPRRIRGELRGKGTDLFSTLWLASLQQASVRK